MTILNALIVEPKNTASHAVIWLHGLGADGHDFASIVPELRLPESLNIRFLFPHAPVMPVSINQGYEMRAWFDIASEQLTTKIDHGGILKSIERIEALISVEEKKGILPENILLAGFSQGALIALAAGLSSTKPLAGIVALSGYLPETFIPKDKPHLTPIFLAHGTEDGIVPFSLGELTQQSITAAGYPLTFRAYRMGHSVCGEEVGDISTFIQKAFGV